MNRFLFTLMKFFNTIFPKDNNKIVFESTPDFSDNSKALFEYVLTRKNDYKIVWLVSNVSCFSRSEENIKFVYKYSINGFLEIISSRYIISTHSFFSTLKSKKQIYVNLWHGMPLKNMGFLDTFEAKDDLETLRKSWNSTDVLIATSTIMRNTISACFNVNPKKIYITGQPRNDKLFLKDNNNPLSQILSQFDLSKFDKIILFCPTFRVWNGRIDGKPINGELFDFIDYDKQQFIDFLNDNNILFLVKLHPYEEKNCYFDISYSNNIEILTSKLFFSNNIDLYDILNQVDILITDYSSIYFDFLLLNKPILFIPTDIMEYSSLNNSRSRGFTLEPYDFWAPGPKSVNFKEFLSELKKCIDFPDYYHSEREIVNNIINKFQDGNSCKRVYDLIFKK